MTYKPQKPLSKSFGVTERWTKKADDRIGNIEKRLDNLEKKLLQIVEKIKTGKNNQTNVAGYTIRQKS